MTSFRILYWATLHFVFAISLACNNHFTESRKAIDTSISKITYSSSGGRSGNYESLDISADSLIYVQARRGDEKTINQKTVKRDWDNLIKSVNLKDFDRIKSNPGHALYDGIDVMITIESGQEKHSLVNGEEDPTNYKKIQLFIDVLEKKLAELRKKIIW